MYPLIVLVVCGAWFRWRAHDLGAMTAGDETAATLGIAVALVTGLIGGVFFVWLLGRRI